MKKFIFILFLILIAPFYLYAWPRLGRGSTTVSQNSGNRATGFSVTVTSNTPVLVYSPDVDHREVFLQNTNATYYIACGTFSAVSDTAGVPRWYLPPKPTGFTTNGTYSIYCIAESAAGSASLEIVGSAEYDSAD